MTYKAEMLKGLKRVIDEKALTIYEMVEETGRPWHYMSRHASDMVRIGKWEQVWKYNGKRVQKAYRPKKHA